MRTSTRRRLEISRFAHNKALHYIARAREDRLSNLLRQQLTAVVEGYFGRCDEEAARHGLEWMRNQARACGGPRRSPERRSYNSLVMAVTAAPAPLMQDRDEMNSGPNSSRENPLDETEPSPILSRTL